MAKIFIQTFGCSLNQSDSEVMAGLLEEHGFEIVDNLKDSDLVIINTCTVKNSAEAKAFAAIRNAEKNKKKIVIAGCVAQAQKDYLETKLKNYSVVGVEQLSNIAEAAEQTLQGNVVHLIAEKKSKRINLPKIRRNNIIEIVPICAGCLGHCTYCKAKQARGKLYSYDEKAIVKQICDAV
ncbi:threonylcarbamoyladenosine tRNA methylthiotransferase, partial [Candidatus Woesearchaeota archaeon]|nr:threonylcarbamoyladenosine tRNA methylthiotransferase [Candidatus Woesearchaeota archaeon]